MGACRVLPTRAAALGSFLALHIVTVAPQPGTGSIELDGNGNIQVRLEPGAKVFIGGVDVLADLAAQRQDPAAPCRCIGVLVLVLGSVQSRGVELAAECGFVEFPDTTTTKTTTKTAKPTQKPTPSPTSSPTAGSVPDLFRKSTRNQAVYMVGVASLKNYELRC